MHTLRWHQGIRQCGKAPERSWHAKRTAFRVTSRINGCTMARTSSSWQHWGHELQSTPTVVSLLAKWRRKTVVGISASLRTESGLARRQEPTSMSHVSMLRWHCENNTHSLWKQCTIHIRCERNVQSTFTVKTMHNPHSLRQQYTFHIPC